jgi:hypothetical protein
MIKIDTLLGSKTYLPGREERICMSGALLLIVSKSVLANRGIVNGTMAWSIDVHLQLDDGGENT